MSPSFLSQFYTLWSASFTLLGFLLCALLALSTGRAFAQTWTPLWHGIGACLPLALALRWLHYALFDHDLWDGAALGVNFFTCLGFYLTAYLWHRRRQMKKQYYWLN